MNKETIQTAIAALQLQRKLWDEQNPHTFVSEWRQELYNKIDTAIVDLEIYATQTQHEWSDRQIEDYANENFGADCYFEVVQSMKVVRDSYGAARRIAQATEDNNDN